MGRLRASSVIAGLLETDVDQDPADWAMAVLLPAAEHDDRAGCVGGDLTAASGVRDGGEGFMARPLRHGYGVIGQHLARQRQFRVAEPGAVRAERRDALHHDLFSSGREALTNRNGSPRRAASSTAQIHGLQAARTSADPQDQRELHRPHRLPALPLRESL